MLTQGGGTLQYGALQYGADAVLGASKCQYEYQSGKDKPYSGEHLQDAVGESIYYGLYWRGSVPNFTNVLLSGESGSDEGSL